MFALFAGSKKLGNLPNGHHRAPYPQQFLLATNRPIHPIQSNTFIFYANRKTAMSHTLDICLYTKRFQNFASKFCLGVGYPVTFPVCLPQRGEKISWGCFVCDPNERLRISQKPFPLILYIFVIWFHHTSKHVSVRSQTHSSHFFRSMHCIEFTWFIRKPTWPAATRHNARCLRLQQMQPH